jgi:hypothetical protein
MLTYLGGTLGTHRAPSLVPSSQCSLWHISSSRSISDWSLDGCATTEYEYLVRITFCNSKKLAGNAYSGLDQAIRILCTYIEAEGTHLDIEYVLPVVTTRMILSSRLGTHTSPSTVTTPNLHISHLQPCTQNATLQCQ